MKRNPYIVVTIVSLFGLAACQSKTAESESPETKPVEAKEGKSKTDAPAMRDLDRGPPEHVTYRPADIEWKDGPAAFEKGAQMAVLEGDPSKDGVFTLHIKLPAGFVINPHSHPNVERVTVLKGTAYLGSGDKVTKKGAEKLVPGTYTAMPPKMVHYVITEEETIAQLSTVGPWEINYVNTAHDPRKRDTPADRPAGAAQ